MAMITNPQIVFLDEPTLGLDVRARRDLWNILLELKGQITMILTTHYLDEVEALADRVGIMHRVNYAHLVQCWS
ncbi:ABC-2 type transport system ATP-binding protein OS=Ureibacillus acetophenoni OX=614649 GN=SAMN05877842_11140 PE=4 SV=1 [Ureibacillus acetophenoni]